MIGERPLPEALGRGESCGACSQTRSVKRFVVNIRDKRSPEAKVVITTAAGEEARVDHGDGPMVREPTTGKFRRTRVAVRGSP